MYVSMCVRTHAHTHLFSPPIMKEILTDGEFLTFIWLFHFKMCLHGRISIYIHTLLSIERYKGQYKRSTLLAYIGYCKQNMTAISSNKKVCVRCAVLRLCSKYRRVRELTTSARARLACPSARVREW